MKIIYSWLKMDHSWPFVQISQHENQLRYVAPSLDRNGHPLGVTADWKSQWPVL
jgi:hypothetical protein